MYSVCPICKGRGEFFYYDEEGEPEEENCKACGGAGHIPQSWSQDYEELIK